MASNPHITETETIGVVRYEITANGEGIPEDFCIKSIMTKKEVNKISSSKLVFFDGDPADQSFILSSQEQFKPGSEIEIKASHDDLPKTIYKGIVIKQSIKHKRGNSSFLEVECRDEAVKLTIAKKNKYFSADGDSEIKDQDAFKEILGDLAGDIEDTATDHKKLIQHFSTDWDFLVSRAEANCRLTLVDDGKVSVVEPKLKNSVFVVSYGTSIIEFDAELDSRFQFSKVKSRTWDPATGSVLEEESSVPEQDGQGNLSSDELASVLGIESYDLQHSGYLNNTELKAWADGKMIKSRLSKVKGYVKIYGTSLVSPGDTITLEGLGERFSGDHYVSSVRQELYEGNWFTTIKFGLDFEWFTEKVKVSSTPTEGLLPAIHGLQIGRVTKIHEDSDSEERVLVKIPVIDDNVDGVWARVARIDAGTNRGVIFHPEVGDEVIIGFVNDDPREPVVLGSLYSSRIPTPITATEENYQKGIITKEDLRLVFDDELKAITLSTPSGNMITISEDTESIGLEDQNGNKIEMTPDGIIVESASDLSLMASGDVNISGTNIALESSAEFTAEAGSNATLSGGAQAVIEGALVKIN